MNNNVEFSALTPVPDFWDDEPTQYKLRLSNEKTHAEELVVNNIDTVLEKLDNTYLDFLHWFFETELKKIPSYQTIKIANLKKFPPRPTAMIHILDDRGQWVNIGYGHGKFCYYIPGRWDKHKLWKRIRQSYYSAYQFNKFLYGELPEMLNTNLGDK